MPNQGGTPTGATNGGSGTFAWSNPTNAEAGGGVGYAQCALTTSGTPSQTLAVDFGGFSLPGGATLNGFAASITRWNAGGPSVQDLTVLVNVGGVACAANRAATALSWPGSSASEGYGGPTDLWGQLPTDFTVANINSLGASVGLQVEANTGIAGIARVSLITFTIYYNGGRNQSSAMLLTMGMG